jgi:hypothetical protein
MTRIVVFPCDRGRSVKKSIDMAIVEWVGVVISLWAGV